jgi:hypothetical protein
MKMKMQYVYAIGLFVLMALAVADGDQGGGGEEAVGGIEAEIRVGREGLCRDRGGKEDGCEGAEEAHGSWDFVWDFYRGSPTVDGKSGLQRL